MSLSLRFALQAASKPCHVDQAPPIHPPPPVPSALPHPVTFLAQTEAGKELKEWDLLSCAAANNAIRVTDCQEEADLRLMMMRARSSPRAPTHLVLAE